MRTEKTIAKEAAEALKRLQPGMQTLKLEQNSTKPEDEITKAGVLPLVIKGDTILAGFRQPIGNKPEKGAPPFEICKGTRQFQQADGTWIDWRHGHKPGAGNALEPLASTALREASEELGLPLDKAIGMVDIGRWSYTSISTGEEVHSKLYVLIYPQVPELQNTNVFGTQEVRFLPLADARNPEKLHLREDNYRVLDALDERRAEISTILKKAKESLPLHQRR